jgi:hypothetical protein
MEDAHRSVPKRPRATPIIAAPFRPRRRPVGAQPLDGRLARRRVECPAVDVLEPAVEVERIERRHEALRRLDDGARVRRDARRAQRQALDHRQPPSFDEGRIDREEGVLVQPHERRVGDVVEDHDLVGDAAVEPHARQQVLCTPADHADEHEQRRAVVVPRHEGRSRTW